MTPKQILDSFSETLMQDERILSAQERALLRNLLHHVRSASLEPESHAVVNATIASAVGETVVQRAFEVLGGNIVERILEGSSSSTSATMEDAALSAEKPPTPGHPRPPQPKPTPKPPEPSPRPEDLPIPVPGPGMSAINRPIMRTALISTDTGVE